MNLPQEVKYWQTSHLHNKPKMTPQM